MSKLLTNSSATETSGTELLDLNDDCIEQIFKLLSPLDMCSVQSTCVRFQNLADKFFAIYQAKTDEFQSPSALLQKGDRIKLIKCFGRHIKKLNVEFLRDDEIREILKLVDVHCNENLTEVYLDLFYVPHLCLTPNILRNLEKISISMVDEDANLYENVLKHCPKLKSLCLGDIGICNNDIQKCRSWMMQSTYPTLKSLSIVLDKYDEDLDIVLLITFLRQNPNIKRISVPICHDSTLNRLLTSINDKWISVEEVQLSINYSSIYATPFSRNVIRDGLLMLNEHNILKHLKLRCGGQSDSIALFLYELAADSSLIGLNIRTDGILDFSEDLCRAITALTNLKQLTLGYITVSNRLNYAGILSEHLLNLEELDLITADNGLRFEELEPFVKNSPKLQTIHIDLHDSVLAFKELNLSTLIEKRDQIVGASRLKIIVRLYEVGRKELEKSLNDPDNNINNKSIVFELKAPFE